MLNRILVPCFLLVSACGPAQGPGSIGASDAATDAGASTEAIAFSIHFTGAPPVPPGNEGIRCLDFKGPDHDVYVSGWRVKKFGLHHLNVYIRKSTTAFTYATPTICGGGFGPGFFVLDSSKPDYVERFGDVPGRENAALLIPAGSVLLMDTHFLNTTDGPLVADAVVDFFPAASHEIDVRGAELMGCAQCAGAELALAPGAKTTRTFSTANPTPEKPAATINPIHRTLDWISFMGHQHKAGVLETVSFDGVEVYRSSTWAEPPIAHPLGITSDATTIISWSCSIENTTPAVIGWGSTLSDEMCEFFGLFATTGGAPQSWEGKGPPVL